jgi:hypothetical protein
MTGLKKRDDFSLAGHTPAVRVDARVPAESSPPTPAWTLGWSQAEPMAQAFATLAGDLALVMDDKGLVLAAAQGEAPAEGGWAQAWVGQIWMAMVSPCSRSKAERLLARSLGEGPGRASEINVLIQDGHQIAMRFSGLRLGPTGPLLIIGRDLAAQSALQGRLLALQRELEGFYWDASSGAGSTH